MAKLVYSLGGAFLGDFSLEKDRMSIGRRTYNDIHIDNLAISGEHAAVIRVGNHFLVEDLESTNGTVVNGKAIKRHRLHHGDVIGLGKYQLKFVDEAELQPNKGALKESADPADAVPSGAQGRQASSFVATEHPAESPGSEGAAAGTEGSSDGCARIRVLSGLSAGNELVLSKALTSMGKPGVHVAVIARRPHGYFVIHVEGEKYPMINGESVGTSSHQLHDHDVVEIAGVRMEFLIADV